MTALSAFQRIRNAAPTISVGMLTANLRSLGAEIALLEKTGVQLVHFDVMDGRFCPMLTLGPPVVAAVQTSMLKDVHLMIEEPLDQLSAFVAAGADILTFHVESTGHPHRVLQALGGMENANDPARGLIRGVALNPGTPLGSLEPLIGDLDYVLLLAVNPGWGGQSFIDSTADRLARVREMIAASGREILVGVDGGVKKNNLERIAGLGPDLIITGSAVFDGVDPEANARIMLEVLG
jgi:ribulose-phosphate 3-epimerase